MKTPDTETRIFCRLAASEPIVELVRIPYGATDGALADIIGGLPANTSFEIMDRAVRPERMCARRGHRRLRCDTGRVRQDFAAIQQAAAGDPGVMFV